MRSISKLRMGEKERENKNLIGMENKHGEHESQPKIMSISNANEHNMSIRSEELKRPVFDEIEKIATPKKCWMYIDIMIKNTWSVQSALTHKLEDDLIAKKDKK